MSTAPGPTPPGGGEGRRWGWPWDRRPRPRSSNPFSTARLKPPPAQSSRRGTGPGWSSRWANKSSWRGVRRCSGRGAAERCTNQIGLGPPLGPWRRWPNQPGGRALLRVLKRLVWQAAATASIRFCHWPSTAARCHTARIGCMVLPLRLAGSFCMAPTTRPVWGRPCSRTRTRSPIPAGSGSALA